MYSFRGRNIDGIYVVGVKNAGLDIPQLPQNLVHLSILFNASKRDDRNRFYRHMNECFAKCKASVEEVSRWEQLFCRPVKRHG